MNNEQLTRALTIIVALALITLGLVLLVATGGGHP